MKAIKIFLFAFLLFAAGTINAQVGIGTPTPNASAQLDVSSTSKGFLPPRLTQVQRNAIKSPAPGLIIWCKDCGASGEIQVFNGTTWTNLSGGIAAPTSILIGTQKWMLRNLDVTTFRNGDTIKEVKDATTWADPKTGPAWCYYDNNPANDAIYGKIYNRAAVEDPRGLAPAGLRIPTLSELSTLVDGLGGYTVASDKMREVGTAHWIAPNSGATNESGFTGLPGGRRNPDGSFTEIGSSGFWWSGNSEEQYYKPGGNVVLVHGLYLNVQEPGYISYEIGQVYIGGEFVPTPSEYGFSVRCINETVTIGNQEWMQRNLDVATYSNGEPIQEVVNPAVWDTLTTGAWCYYDYNSGNGTIYGKLYNWYAVTDPRGLAPKGWHVASDDEWTTLTNYLGGETVPFPAGGYEIKIAGGKLKEVGTTHWTSPNTDATNGSGFSALPGGKIEPGGTFKSIHDVGSWWTSSEANSRNALYREAHYENGSVYRWGWTKTAGLSVRCVRD